LRLLEVPVILYVVNIVFLDVTNYALWAHLTRPGLHLTQGIARKKEDISASDVYYSGNIRYWGNPLSIGEPEVCYVATNCYSAFDADIQTLLSQKATTGHGANRSRESTSKV
jgi:hypothetical protein